MPSLSSNASTFRRGGYSYTGYLSVIPQTVILTGTVSATPTFPTLTIAYTTDTGSSANVKTGMTVILKSSGGTQKALLRVATGGAITSTSLPVNEVSQGVADIVSGDKITVVDEWRIWDKLSAATAALDRDSRIAYSDQGSNPNPVACSGGAVAGFGTSIAFDGSASYVVDSDGSTLTHSWDFVDGTPSSSSSATPTSVFPVGFRWVSHTVTDSTNSKVSVQRIPVWVHDNDEYPPLAVQVDSLSGNVDNGWRCSFKLPVGDEGSITNVPDGCLVTYWEREAYANTVASYGSNVSGRSHVKFVGFLSSESIHIDPDSDECVFEAVSPLEILSQTPALPQLMVSANTPAKWSEVKSLSTKKMWWYIAQWGSNLLDAFDLVMSDILDISYERIAVEGQTLAEQLRDIANSLNLQVTCDRLGRILFTRDPAFLTTVQRTARTKTYDLTTADIMEADITRRHRGNVKAVRGEGITSGNVPVFADSPGSAPASYGAGSDTLAKQIVSSIDQLLDRTEKHFAKINGLYNGQFVPKGTRIKLPDGYDWFEPAYREFITLTLPTTLNTRRIGFTSATKWTVEAVDITYDLELGSKDISITIDHETDGDGATVYVPPQEGENGLPDMPPIDVDFPSLGVDPATGIGIDAGAPVGGVTSPATKTMAIFLTDNTMRQTANFNHPEGSGGPTWDSTDLTALSGWGSGDLLAFEVDPYSPSYVGTGSEVNGVLVTDENVQQILDIFGTPTLGTAFTFTDTTEARTIALDRNVEGFGIVASWVLGDGVYAAVTLDGGATWTEDLVTAFENTAAGGIAPGVWISPHTAGKAEISVWTATGDNTDAEASVYRTLNSGTSWSHLTSPDIESGVDVSSFIGVPFANTAGTTIFHRKKDVDGLHLIRNVSGTETDITPTTTLSYVPIGQRGHEIALPDDSGSTLAAICATGAAISNGLWVVSSGFGTLVSQTSTSITVDAEFNGSQYQTMVTTGAADACQEYGGYTVDSGNISSASTFWNECGETPETTTHSGLLTTGCINTVSNASFDPYRVTYHFSDDCGDGNGVIAYALLETSNAYDDEPTWTNLDSGETFPYRQVFAIGGGAYLCIGLEGAIGVASGSGVNSRKGNISSTGEVIGTAGV